MALDVTNLIGATVRAVKDGERDGRPTRAVVATARYDTTVDDLWDAITSAERIPRWFMPISGDLRLGGRYQLQGNAGGTITECEAPRRLAVTWEFGGQESWVTVDLSPDGEGRTSLHLRHIAEVGDDDTFWRQYGPGAVGVGWDLSLLGLALYISGDTSITPEKAEAWMTSPEAKAFVRASSAGWFDASVAYGTDRAEAEAARDETTRFYTGGEA